MTGTNKHNRMTQARKNLNRIKRLLAPYRKKQGKRVTITCDKWSKSAAPGQKGPR